ncbi:hypothetical protein J6590_044421 [Homalodisca vitripennis]|nr:hypothetical protein J6590_044421 [Homalodisca vitripennis]
MECSNLGAYNSVTAAIAVSSSNSDECTATALSTGSPNPCQGAHSSFTAAIAVGSSNSDECTATVLSTVSANPCQGGFGPASACRPLFDIITYHYSTCVAKHTKYE